MNTSKTIEIYRDAEIAFQTNDAWVNATHMAKPFGKRPNDFLGLPTTKAYIAALVSDLAKSDTRKSGIAQGPKWENPTSVYRTAKGGKLSSAEQGTWMHPDLAMEFAGWLSPEFKIWCNRTIRRILSGVGNTNSRDVELVTAFTGLTKAVEGITKIVAAHDERLNAVMQSVIIGDEFSQRLTLGHHNLQTRIEALEGASRQRAGSPSPRLRLLPAPRSDALSHMAEIDRILFTAESADWWVGTPTMLRRRLAGAGLHIRQLGLEALSINKSKRCMALKNVARGAHRAYAILRPGYIADSLAMSLIHHQVRNLRAA